MQRLSAIDPRRPDVIKHFKEARAAARKTIKEAKQQSWSDFVAKISPKSTTTELWSTVNTLRGNRKQRALVLRRDSGYTDDPREVAEELAQYYYNKSSTSSYPSAFQKIKEKTERQDIVPTLDTDEIYNNEFTMGELMWALDKGRSVSTGPDNIGYPMLQRLPFTVKKSLLGVLNKIWRSGIYPRSWRTGIVIPIPKPDSCELGAAAFRPISLTSCLSKIFERIVNRRLTVELESNGRLDHRQHAFRPGRGTNTYLADLESLR